VLRKFTEAEAAYRTETRGFCMKYAFFIDSLQKEQRNNNTDI
jgi:hypothetical protein